MSASTPPPEDLVTRFLQLVADRANQPVFVHCERGQDRTGALTAIYRLTHDHWTLDRVYAEMRQYHFGNDALKSVVDAYARRVRAK
jgi:tyrosine-protein phosphatase SIW14